MLRGAGILGGPEGFWGDLGRVPGVSRRLNSVFRAGCPAGRGVGAPGLLLPVLLLGVPGLRPPQGEGRRGGSLSSLSGVLSGTLGLGKRP